MCIRGWVLPSTTLAEFVEFPAEWDGNTVDPPSRYRPRPRGHVQGFQGGK